MTRVVRNGLKTGQRRQNHEAIGMGVGMVMFRADGKRRTFPITRDVTVIGRREDCDLRIPLGDVSRKHCRLIVDGELIRVEDLGSSNGTYRNGERVQQTDLSAGDTLQVGPVVFVVQVNGAPADEDLQPVTVQSAAA
jgi:pSer/pThr/pTyr-binding forkhead associated (FHA) protein